MDNQIIIYTVDYLIFNYYKDTKNQIINGMDNQIIIYQTEDGQNFYCSPHQQHL